jgi:hypothetical protein
MTNTGFDIVGDFHVTDDTENLGGFGQVFDHRSGVPCAATVFLAKKAGAPNKNLANAFL